MTRAILIIPVICLACACSVRAGQLERLKEIYGRESASIQAAFAKNEAAAGDDYVKDLNRLIAYMERKGDDFGLRPTQAEKQRYLAERSVPEASEVGTPELITKARKRYRARLAPAVKARNEKMAELTEQYVKSLEKLKSGVPEQDAAAIDAEIARVSGDSEGENGQPSSLLVLRGSLRSGVIAAYQFGKTGGIPDLSVHGRHGLLVSGKVVGNDAHKFSDYTAKLTVEPIPLGKYWTASARVLFPLQLSAKGCVLLSGGYRQDHLAVDADGNLGNHAGTFASCGFNVSELNGWRQVTVATQAYKTWFFIDDKPVGSLDRIVTADIQSIGNSTAAGQPWSGTVKSVCIWGRCLTAAEIAELVAQMEKADKAET